MTIGTKIKGKINNEIFEIVNIFEENGKTYYCLKHLKSGKTFKHAKKYVEHLLIDIITE